MPTPIYLDHAATTPVHPRVIEAMQHLLASNFGNPSSVHSFGRSGRMALEKARDTVAQVMGAESKQVIFTSSGTEADNMALFGVAMANQHRGKHIITTKIEHHAVLHTCEYLEQFGFEVTYLPVDQTGRVNPEAVKEAVRPDTILVSVMYANNEVGTIQPVEEIGAFLREVGVYFHTDAVQAFGVIPFDVKSIPVDLLSVSAHKLNGPKGVGALYVHRDVKINPHLFGGAQERKKRAGTENVAGIVGFAEAVAIASAEMAERVQKYASLRDKMLQVWREAGVQFVRNGSEEHSVPHILNVSFPGVSTETLLMNLDLAGIAASSGSACASGSLELSHVLQAMNIGDERTASAVRFSFGITNDVADVQQAAEKTAQIVQRLLKK